MVVCRYYQQGRCRYGDKCRFEHPTGDVATSGQRVQFRDSFGTGQQNQYKWSAGGQQPQQTQQSNPADVVNGLSKEMQVWEQSKMWPFSCVAMEKDLPSLPDFLDISPEELRLQAYTAMKESSMQPYISKVQELVTDYNNKRHQLKLPTLELKQNLVRLLEEQRKQESGSLTKSSVFGASSSSSFGSTSANNLFGKPLDASSTNQGAFGSSHTANQGAFGSSSTNQGLFGSSTAGQGTFASAATSSSVFGGSSGGSGGSSIFGNAAASTTTGMFGSPQATAAPATAGLFGSSPAPSSFGAGTSPGFGNSMKTNLFGAGTSSSPFGAGTFGASPQAPASPAQPTEQGFSAAASPPSGLFGNAAPSQEQAAPQSGGSLLLPTPQNDPSLSTVYTPMDKLTEDEKAQFLASSFTLGKVPMKPPPRELIM